MALGEALVDDAVAADAETLVLRLLAPDLERSIALRLRVERLRLTLAARGLNLFSPDAERWLAPVLCRSKADQAAFPAAFARAASAARSGPPPPTPEPQPGPPPSTRRQSLWRGWAWSAAMVITIVVAAAAGLWWESGPGGPNRQVAISVHPSRQQTVSTGVGTKPSPPEPTPTSVPAATAPRLLPWRLALAAFAALLIFITLALSRPRRRNELLRDDLTDAAQATKLALAAGRPNLFDDARLPATLAALGSHGAQLGGRLDARRSIRGTIRCGGYPEFVRAARPLAPEYLLCVDEASPRDHLAVLADALLSRFRSSGMVVRRFGFFENPDQLVEHEAGGRRHGFTQLAASQPLARLLLVSETNRLLTPQGELATCLSAVPPSTSIALLNPRRETEWSGDERILDQASVGVFSASPKGLRRYADWLRSAHDPHSGARRPPRVDLATLLERRRRRLLTDGALTAIEIAELIDDLVDWMGHDLLRLLRTIAVFPRVEPALTLALAAALQDREGRCLLKHPDFLQTSRLVWLRAGYMPNSLRRALVVSLTEADLAATVVVITGFLSAEAGSDQRAALDLRLNRRRSLRPSSPKHAEALEDRILMRALNGGSPSELGVEAPQVVVDRILAQARRLSLFHRQVVLAALQSLARLANIWLRTQARKLRATAIDANFGYRLAGGLAAGVLVMAVSAPFLSVQAPLPSDPPRAPSAPRADVVTPPVDASSSPKETIHRPPCCQGFATASPGDTPGGRISAGVSPNAGAKPVDLSPAEQTEYAAKLATFSSGLTLPGKSFFFGADYSTVADSLGASVPYASTPRAGEYQDEIHYVWVYDKDLRGLDDMLKQIGATPDAHCIDPQSYITFFFKEQIFFHISLRLARSGSCPGYDWLRQGLFGSGNQATVPSGSYTTSLIFHEEQDYSILEITRQGVANESSSIFNETGAGNDDAVVRRSDNQEIITIPSQIAGVISGIFVRQGQAIERGQALFTLDPRAAQASLGDLKAKTALIDAKIHLLQEQLALLKARVSVGQAAASEVGAAEANLSRVQDEASSDKSQQDAALQSLAYTRATSPVCGTVLEVRLQPGSHIEAQQPAMLVRTAACRPSATLLHR